jgi:RNA polymerase sigma-70 factor (ECF subfamily)
VVVTSLSRLTSVSDEALLAGMALGDADACLVFVRRNQRAVFGLALRYLNDKALAEDVAQQAFTKAWENAAAFDPRRASVLTWLLVITRNIAIDELRRRKPEPVSPDAVVAIGDRIHRSGPLHHLLAREDLRTVALTIDGLSEPLRRALLLASWYGCTAQQIADLEGIPLGTAKTRIRTALIRLRDGMAAADPESRSR